MIRVKRVKQIMQEKGKSKVSFFFEWDHEAAWVYLYEHDWNGYTTPNETVELNNSSYQAQF